MNGVPSLVLFLDSAPCYLGSRLYISLWGHNSCTEPGREETQEMVCEGEMNE